MNDYVWFHYRIVRPSWRGAQSVALRQSVSLSVRCLRLYPCSQLVVIVDIKSVKVLPSIDCRIDRPSVGRRACRKVVVTFSWFVVLSVIIDIFTVSSWQPVTHCLYTIAYGLLIKHLITHLIYSHKLSFNVHKIAFCAVSGHISAPQTLQNQVHGFVSNVASLSVVSHHPSIKQRDQLTVDRPTALRDPAMAQIRRSRVTPTKQHLPVVDWA